jgi:hypothetical protein
MAGGSSGALVAALLLWFCAALGGQRTAGSDQAGGPGARALTPQFQTAENCLRVPQQPHCRLRRGCLDRKRLARIDHGQLVARPVLAGIGQERDARSPLSGARSLLYVSVRDKAGRVLFESGAVQASGAIAGNDNDADASKYEPHYDDIRSADQVQIYESVMVDSDGAVTTGLLTGTRFVKDNRLLPRGFDKSRAEADLAVRGDAAEDPNFNADGDRVRYTIPLADETGPLTVEVSLRYQPISFRWARNLASYDADEPRRFVSYFDAMSDQSSVVVASTTLEGR